MTGIFSRLGSTKTERVLTGRFIPNKLGEFIDGTVMLSQEYRDVEEYIKMKYPDYQVNFEKFRFHLFQSTIHNHFWNLSPMPLQKIIDAFLNELFHRPIPWEITIWLTGLNLEDNFQHQGFRIEKPTEENLMIERDLNDPPYWLRNARQVVPSAVFETTYRPEEGLGQVYFYVQRLLISLNLFRPGIEEVMIFENPVSLISYSPQRLDNPAVRERLGAAVTEGDFDELKFHITTLPRLITKEMIKGPLYQSTRLAVGYQCYSKAIFKLVAPNEILTELVRGLESLYLELDENTGKATRLGGRVSKAVSCNGLKPNEIKKIVSKSYAIVRSPTSHGTPTTIEKQKSARKRIPTMVELLRKSLLLLIKDGRQSFLNDFKGDE